MSLPFPPTSQSPRVLTWTKCLRHFWAILMKVSQAMSWTPSCVSWKEKRKGRRRRKSRHKKKTAEHAKRKTAHTYTKQRLHLVTMHEFKQLVHNCLQKLPVSPEKKAPTQKKKGEKHRKRLPISFCVYLRNLGYWPTMYMMFEAMMALLSLPLFCSHKPSNSFMTVTKKRFSSSSCMAPLMEPIAQHNCSQKQKKMNKGCLETDSCFQTAASLLTVLRFFHDHSVPSTWW